MKRMKNWTDCTHKQRIERWENAARVLQNLSVHERRRHWDMNRFGDKTDCGTIACAAGHCGLDPWFRNRGLRMDFIEMKDRYLGSYFYTEFDGRDVIPFFGSEGSHGIFFNGDKRSVAKVVSEIRRYIRSLKADVEFMEGDFVRATPEE